MCIYEKESKGLTTCEELFSCCDCGGADCGCPYCWSCNACEECLDKSDN